MPNRANNQEPDGIPAPTSLYALLSSGPHTVGELVDFARALPAPWVRPTAFHIMDDLKTGYRAPIEGAHIRRRKLVILGALIDRLTFEIEDVPPRRNCCI